MDLSPNVEALFQNLDKDCVQRRIRRAERAGLAEKCGASEELLGHFYKLFVETRRRKHVPPPPFSWFRNLARYQGESLSIRIAYKDYFPVAAILTLRFKNTVYYKYGCSHTDSNHFGATPLLLWRAISAAKSSGAEKFDFGRTEVDNTGLLAFKNHWVPRPKCLVYWRFPDRTNLQSLGDWKMKMAKRLFSYMPGNLLRIAGKLVYKHIG
jgi:lipid II:glycine glycyltransferase (peptidoglycan interpeptide bridge formation enzyme)